MCLGVYAQNEEPMLFTCGEIEDTNAIDQCQNNSHFTLDNHQNLKHKLEDVLVDRFGNQHHKQINVTQTGQFRAIPLTPDYISPEGLFSVYLTDNVLDGSISDFNNNVNFRNVIAQIFADLEQIIIENPSTGVVEPVKFEIESNYTVSQTLASASSYYNYASVPPGTIVEGEVWKAINTGSNDANSWDGYIKVNFFHSWYSDYTNPAGIFGTNSFDMYAVLLHEIMHALGFASGIDENGNPKNGNTYLKYDNLLHNDLGDDLIVNTGTNWVFNSALNINTITNGCPSTSEVRLGDNDLPVHTPATYSAGSSLSHIDLNNDCNFPVSDYIMAYAVTVESPRRPSPDEFDVFCNLDYNLSTQFGNNNIIEFGNPAIVTSLSNHPSNIVSYSSCAPLVFAVNDFQDPLTQPTIDSCQGSVLSILEQDLLSNDVSDLGLQLEVTDLSLNGNLITTFTGTAPNRTFLVTPNTVGNLQLTYKPMDTAGNFGNTAYVNIIVTICNTLNCINASTCNLICNSEFLDPTLANLPSFNPFNMAYHMNTNGNGPSELDGWFAMNGSPSFYDFSIPCTESQCGNINYFNLPGSTGEGAVALYGCTSGQPNNGEAILTNVNVFNNVNYLLSVNRNKWIINTAASYQVYLSDNNAINSGSFTGGSCGGTVDILNGLPVQQIASENNITSNQWEQSLFCFTANDDYQSLILNAYSTTNTNSSVLFDNIELIEDKFVTNSANIQTSYDLICGQDAELGQELCLVSNLEYQYWDVTDPSNHFQLTNALVTTNYYVSDLNSAEVILNDIQANVNLELRRVFNSVFSVPINTNACDVVLPITINVQPEAPQNADFTYTVDVSNCLSYTFLANETYETHEWDFDNDGIIDLTGAGNDTQYTNPVFVFPAEGIYTVTHTVYNECGSLTTQENILISCTNPCVNSTTWDGSTWDNGLPDLTKEAIINGNYNTSSFNSFSACALTINAPFVLEISSLDYVEVENNTIVSGQILVNHTGAFVQNSDTGVFFLQGNGSGSVQKITAVTNSNTEVTYISSPLNGSTVGDIMSNNTLINNYRYWFNSANFQDSCYETFNDNTCVPGLGVIYDGIDDNGDDWVLANSNLILEPGIGLAVRASSNTPIPLSFTGCFNTGNINVPVTRNDFEIGDDNPIFIGNPYPSAIDVDAFLERNMHNHPLGTNTDGVIDGLILIWSHNTSASATANGNQALNFDSSDYAMINLTGEIAGGDIGNVPNRFIPSAQGVFVNYSDNVPSSNGTVFFNNTMRVTDNNNQFFRASNSLENKIWFNLSSDTGVHSQILLGYVNNASDADDGKAYDAFEHAPLGQNALVYFNIPQSNKKFVIQGKASSSLTVNEVVSLGFFSSIQSPTIFTLSIDHFQGDFFNNQTVYLKDNALNVCHNLTAQSYSFSSEIGNFANRFDVVFDSCESLGISENTIDDIAVFPNPTKSILTVKSKTEIASLKVYNSLGQLILTEINANQLNISNLSEGVYFLKIKDINKRFKMVRIIKN
ncbi:T9SS type A sorting domain-containing protein [Olleya sp. YS]|uniref:T9SS type A sorting domain-containing protein n=1 Tax=Olleya sp. YS TaxID=3028318 RepID=UPI0024345DA6|nr:T9SS type A sorting domain-containing protein [Olleya sp. YS]WGD35724.1 T9SS type A sorting domain-containing protein [Olleya sp. YS]